MTCALLEDGGIRCWGHNDVGQLGRGDLTVYERPSRVLLPARAIEVDAGVSHACAIVEGGDVYCWGYNDWWQVGPEEGLTTSTPKLVLDGAIDLALGDYHSCAVLATGEVSCWGLNGTYGSVTPVGHGAFGERRPPGLVPGVSGAVHGDAGLDQTCVVRQDRTVTCWGRDSLEEELSDVDAVAIGLFHTCAISGGRVFCWGSNEHGQLGDGTFFNRIRPMPALDLTEARSLAVGATHSCAVVAGGGLFCWGDNYAAQLNDGGWPIDRASPARVDGLTGVLFGDGSRHSCVHTDAEQIECWGWNAWGQVNFATTAIEVVPTVVLGLEPL
jgi:alpha-tubulin suppressor-like RCC1 family protein